MIATSYDNNCTDTGTSSCCDEYYGYYYCEVEDWDMPLLLPVDLPQVLQKEEVMKSSYPVLRAYRKDYG